MQLHKQSFVKDKLLALYVLIKYSGSCSLGVLIKQQQQYSLRPRLVNQLYYF